MRTSYISLSIISFLLLAFYDCKTIPVRDNYNAVLTGFSERVSIPVIKSDGLIKYYEDTTNIYYYNQFILFETQIEFDSSYNGELVFSKILNAYFLYDTACSNGLYYSPVAPSELKVRSVDSLVNSKITRLLSIDSNRIISTTQNSSADGDIKKLIRLRSAIESNVDSIILTYKKINELFSYSICPRYDTIDALKLVRYNLILHIPSAKNLPSNLKFNSSVEVIELGEFDKKSPIFKIFHKLKTAYTSIVCK